MAELPGLFTPTGNPESVLYPSKANRTHSTDLEKGVLSATERLTAKPAPEHSGNQSGGPSYAEKPEDIPGNAVVSTDAPDKSRLFSVPEAAYGGLGTFLPFRLLAHDESTAATKGSDTPRVDPIDHPTSKAPLQKSGQKEASVDDSSSQSTTNPFDYSPTPAREVSWGPGGLAYIVNRSNETLNIVAPVGDAINATDPDPSTVAGCEVERRKILEAVQASLDHLQHPTLRVPDKSNSQKRPENQQYLLSKHDIQHTVDLVLRMNEGRRDPGSYKNEGQPQADVPDQSTSGRPRVYMGCHALLAENKSGADSATTICHPTTSYAKLDLEDNAVRTHSRDRGLSSSTTTVISKRSISKIT